MADMITIGIAGGTGSGKTTITRRILREFGGNVSVLYHDNYYKRHDDMTYEERTKLNYDHPNAFDTPLLVKHLAALRAMPNVMTWRPADANETAFAWVEILHHTTGPSCPLTTRQNVPVLDGVTFALYTRETLWPRSTSSSVLP